MIIKKSLDSKEESLTLEEVVHLVEWGATLYVKSYDEASKKDVFSKITNAALTNPIAQVLKVSYNGKEVTCTPDHKFWTQRGWVEAQHLMEDDELLEV